MTSRREYAVLAALDLHTVPDEVYACFSQIAENSDVPTQSIRRTVRSLARKGYAKYCKGLWSEDGEPRGAGYAITEAGREHLTDWILSP